MQREREHARRGSAPLAEEKEFISILGVFREETKSKDKRTTRSRKNETRFGSRLRKFASKDFG